MVDLVRVSCSAGTSAAVLSLVADYTQLFREIHDAVATQAQVYKSAADKHRRRQIGRLSYGVFAEGAVAGRTGSSILVIMGRSRCSGRSMTMLMSLTCRHLWVSLRPLQTLPSSMMILNRFSEDGWNDAEH